MDTDLDGCREIGLSPRCSGCGAVFARIETARVTSFVGTIRRFGRSCRSDPIRFLPFPTGRNSSVDASGIVSHWTSRRLKPLEAMSRIRSESTACCHPVRGGVSLRRAVRGWADEKLNSRSSWFCCAAAKAKVRWPKICRSECPFATGLPSPRVLAGSRGRG